MGNRVQWRIVRESFRRVDGAGIIARMIQLCCIARQKYSVPAPLSLVHIDTNHKLIRYNIVSFGGIDGFSRKVSILFCIHIAYVPSPNEQPQHQSGVKLSVLYCRILKMTSATLD
ncbi:unnamed protein product [Oncorhynchus mykiss]|uniref:Integrase core domain-containing protein n=1 Tax=Oncorhynchus mykiss TaxID=8022 RepID=A0A060XIM2_ONCMY|nr:unnamed protein product [Oncorhynchus mykiss]